ncbi:unnamed protein product [Chrysoparadoxa australica]
MDTRRQGQVIIRDEDVGQLVVQGCIKFAKTHKPFMGMWMFGLLILIVASGFTPPPESVASYEKQISSLDIESLAVAEEELWEAEHRYDESRGWFWRCDDYCQEMKLRYQDRKRFYDVLEKEYRTGVAEAKSELGMFSHYAVEETRDLWWQRVAGGKNYAKRATMYDALFTGIGAMSRDEGIFEWLVRMAFKVLMNLTIGLVGAIITFGWTIWSVITSYNPSVVSAVVFFVCAILAACSVLFTWLFGLFTVGELPLLNVASH